MGSIAPPPAAPSVIASASSAAASTDIDPFPEPPPPAPPANDTERDARLVVEVLVGGWTMVDYHPLVARLTGTEAMHQLDKACDRGDGAACAIAGAGYLDRQLSAFVVKRFSRGCELGNASACALVLYGLGDGSLNAGFQSDVYLHGRSGETPGEVALRRAEDLCAAGVGAGCYTAARFGGAKPIAWRYARWVRACALGTFEACRLVVAEVGAGKWITVADKPREVDRVTRIVRRACAALPGSCVHLARFFGKPTTWALDRDLSDLRAELLQRGCANPADPTLDKGACGVDGGAPAASP